ncbi:hypothetical protein LX16_0707 [Stackebrandtia albiflava]|uniref:Uncharacterized protein n=1 Tax=Stackebrandtia albiflava TaxID=406432 RepID=A0A562VAZ3_9ACTN|nr:hypothetical protein [Stackebrandtia albiflava]TWJ15011.1 hypothetical protein LX16_0707 [Stackebrandtia albiflava]
MRKLMFAAGLAAGYVLGAKAGRERYEQIMDVVRRIRENPTVHNTTATLKEQAEHIADASKDRLMQSNLGHKLFGDDTHDKGGLDPNPQYWEKAGVNSPSKSGTSAASGKSATSGKSSTSGTSAASASPTTAATRGTGRT